MNKVRLEILPWLSSAFGDKHSGRLILEEEVREDATVGDLLDQVAARYDGFAEMAFDRQSKKLSSQISVIVNDRLFELLQGLETRLQDGSTVVLLPAFAGG